MSVHADCNLQALRYAQAWWCCCCVVLTQCKKGNSAMRAFVCAVAVVAAREYCTTHTVVLELCMYVSNKGLGCVPVVKTRPCALQRQQPSSSCCRVQCRASLSCLRNVAPVLASTPLTSSCSACVVKPFLLCLVNSRALCGSPRRHAKSFCSLFLKGICCCRLASSLCLRTSHKHARLTFTGSVQGA
jgi:hypothetical protein